jgi:hypothetical protein
MALAGPVNIGIAACVFEVENQFSHGYLQALLAKVNRVALSPYLFLQPSGKILREGRIEAYDELIDKEELIQL